MSASEVVQPPKQPVFDLSSPETLALIERAQESDALDHALTIRQALRKYPKAVFWAMFLSTSLIMEGFDLSIIGSFYGQRQFKERFGTAIDPSTGQKLITAAWQSGLSNSSGVGQLVGLTINGFFQDRFGCRMTMIFFMSWLVIVIFVPVFAKSLAVLAVGEVLCGIGWGVFQTLSTAYASEVVPTVLRPYVTAYVCMCWGTGNLLATCVIRGLASWDGNWGWRLPFVLQWMWPPVLITGAFFAPESPWNAIRRNKPELARKALRKLKVNSPTRDEEIEAQIALIEHTTRVELAETAGASFIECFRGTNLRRTEINCVVWAAQILCGNAIIGYTVVFLEQAGWSDIQAFDLNISIQVCYIVGGVICWFLLSRVGRKVIYMGGMTFMFLTQVAIGGLGWKDDDKSTLAIGLLLLIQTFCNMITVGPACYPIVAETPSGRLRYKTIVIGRFIYVCTGIFANSITPRMISPIAWNWGAKAGLFYAGTNLLCNIWCYFRLPETKDRTFGEIDILFENKVSARKFRTTKADQFAHADAAMQKTVEVEKVASVAIDQVSLV